MNEEKIIKSTESINTVESICIGLSKLGIREGDILLVHSSLSSLGWVCGGAQAVITAFMKGVGKNGTIIMPTHSGDNSDPQEWANPPVPKEWIEEIYENMPAFNVHLTPTRGMGRIPELFRTLPQAYRSNHPQTSFTAVGKYSNAITYNHQLTPQFGMYTPLGKMYRLDAKVLLLGVGFDSCTCFHLAEALNTKMKKKKVGAAIMEGSKRVWKWFEDFDYNSSLDFQEIGEAFEKSGKVTLGRIGNAQCRVFDMKTAVDFAGEWLSENRFK